MYDKKLQKFKATKTTTTTFSTKLSAFLEENAYSNPQPKHVSSSTDLLNQISTSLTTTLNNLTSSAIVESQNNKDRQIQTLKEILSGTVKLIDYQSLIDGTNNLEEVSILKVWNYQLRQRLGVKEIMDKPFVSSTTRSSVTQTDEYDTSKQLLLLQDEVEILQDALKNALNHSSLGNADSDKILKLNSTIEALRKENELLDDRLLNITNDTGKEIDDSYLFSENKQLSLQIRDLTTQLSSYTYEKNAELLSQKQTIKQLEDESLSLMQEVQVLRNQVHRYPDDTEWKGKLEKKYNDALTEIEINLTDKISKKFQAENAKSQHDLEIFYKEKINGLEKKLSQNPQESDVTKEVENIWKEKLSQCETKYNATLADIEANLTEKIRKELEDKYAKTQKDIEAVYIEKINLLEKDLSQKPQESYQPEITSDSDKVKEVENLWKEKLSQCEIKYNDALAMIEANLTEKIRKNLEDEYAKTQKDLEALYIERISVLERELSQKSQESNQPEITSDSDKVKEVENIWKEKLSQCEIKYNDALVEIEVNLTEKIKKKLEAEYAKTQKDLEQSYKEGIEVLQKKLSLFEEKISTGSDEFHDLEKKYNESLSQIAKFEEKIDFIESEYQTKIDKLIKENQKLKIQSTSVQFSGDFGPLKTLVFTLETEILALKSQVEEYQQREKQLLEQEEQEGPSPDNTLSEEDTLLNRNSFIPLLSLPLQSYILPEETERFTKKEDNEIDLLSWIQYKLSLVSQFQTQLCQAHEIIDAQHSKLQALLEEKQQQKQVIISPPPPPPPKDIDTPDLTTAPTNNQTLIAKLVSLQLENQTLSARIAHQTRANTEIKRLFVDSTLYHGDEELEQDLLERYNDALFEIGELRERIGRLEVVREDDGNYEEEIEGE